MIDLPGPSAVTFEDMEKRLAVCVAERGRLASALESLEKVYAYRGKELLEASADRDRFRQAMHASNERAVRWEDKVSQYGREHAILIAERKRLLDVYTAADAFSASLVGLDVPALSDQSKKLMIELNTALASHFQSSSFSDSHKEKGDD